MPKKVPHISVIFPNPRYPCSVYPEHQVLYAMQLCRALDRGDLILLELPEQPPKD